MTSLRLVLSSHPNSRFKKGGGYQALLSEIKNLRRFVKSFSVGGAPCYARRRIAMDERALGAKIDHLAAAGISRRARIGH
jgi:hypothetical protein